MTDTNSIELDRIAAKRVADDILDRVWINRFGLEVTWDTLILFEKKRFHNRTLPHNCG